MSFGKPDYKALSEWEGVDEIKIRQVPRFKTSGLSGDEWRVSAKIEFYRKGILVYEMMQIGCPHGPIICNECRAFYDNENSILKIAEAQAKELEAKDAEIATLRRVVEAAREDLKIRDYIMSAMRLSHGAPVSFNTVEKFEKAGEASLKRLRAALREYEAVESKEKGT